MKSIILFLIFLFITQIAYSQDFITKWVSSRIFFGVETTDTVHYTWTASPSGKSGSGSFTAPNGIYGLLDGQNMEIDAGDTVTLNLAPEHLERFYMHILSWESTLIEMSQWGDASWSSMESMFSGCNNLFISATDTPNLSEVKNMSHTFYGVSSFNQDISGWDVTSVTDMSGLFAYNEVFNQDIGGWDVSNVINMKDMFAGALSFNQNIGGWDVSNVTDMSNMFLFDSSFDRDLSGWNVSKVTDMSGMFRIASSFNADIGDWDVSNVKGMANMFSGAISFNQDISDWDVSNVTDMEEMFWYADSFNQDIGQWNVSNVTDMSGMFDNAKTFNQDISGWDVSNVTDMKFMFYQTPSFNQDIGGWSLNSELDMRYMLDSSGMDCDHYSTILIGWQKNNPSVTYVELGAAGLEYGTSAAQARDSLINVQGWTIEGDIESDMVCDELVSSEAPQINDQGQFLLYPNPANNQIFLSVNNLEYEILNTQGKALQNGRVEGQRIPIDGLPTGIYILQVKDGQKLYQTKFVKE